MQNQNLNQWVENHYHQNFVIHDGKRHYCQEKFIEAGVQTGEASPGYGEWLESHHS